MMAQPANVASKKLHRPTIMTPHKGDAGPIRAGAPVEPTDEDHAVTGCIPPC